MYFKLITGFIASVITIFAIQFEAYQFLGVAVLFALMSIDGMIQDR
jgi:hypothetical protein